MIRGWNEKLRGHISRSTMDFSEDGNKNKRSLNRAGSCFTIPTGSEEREVLGIGSIHIDLLNHNCIDMNIVG